jgi:hypothetical protein
MKNKFILLLLLCSLVLFAACAADEADEGGGEISGGTDTEPSGEIQAETEEPAEETPSINVVLDIDYPGNWGYSSAVPKEDLLAIGGDVKVIVTYMIHDTGGADQFIIAPTMEPEVRITDRLTSNTAVAKDDGWIACHQDATKVEFVISADVISELSDTGLFFQVFNTVVRSVQLLPGEPEAEILLFSDREIKAYTTGGITREELLAGS